MTCLTCTHGALRDAADPKRDEILRRMAKQRLVNCIESPYRATFHRIEHRCNKFAQADEKTAEARRQWAAAKEPR